MNSKKAMMDNVWATPLREDRSDTRSDAEVDQAYSGIPLGNCCGEPSVVQNHLYTQLLRHSPIRPTQTKTSIATHALGVP